MHLELLVNRQIDWERKAWTKTGESVVGVFYIFLSSEKHTPSKNKSERDQEELDIEERKQAKWVWSGIKQRETLL